MSATAKWWRTQSLSNQSPTPMRARNGKNTGKAAYRPRTSVNRGRQCPVEWTLLAIPDLENKWEDPLRKWEKAVPNWEIPSGSRSRLLTLIGSEHHGAQR
jgi:hypothetical protein